MNKINNVKTLFYKLYPKNPDSLLCMKYYLKKDSPERIVKTFTETRRLSEEEREQYEEYYGILCLKCGEFHEYKVTGENPEEWEKNTPICKCGSSYHNRDHYSSNISGLARKCYDGMWESIPYRISITEKEEKIRIAATAKCWYLNPISIKTYSKLFTITVVLNLKTGQSFCMSAIGDGKPVFTDVDIIRNTSLPNATYTSTEFNFVDYGFFRRDPEIRDALNKILRERISGITADCANLTEMVEANYFKDLYPLFLDSKNKDSDYHQPHFYAAWKKLRNRYKENKKTFPKYLYWGCSGTASKSIRKMLYKNPDLKWLLRFLYRDLGITNIDYLRALLCKREEEMVSVAFEYAFEMLYHQNSMVPGMLSALKNSNKSDKEKITFLFGECDALMHIRDSARMLRDCELPASEILKYDNIRICHNRLSALHLKVRDVVKWKRYSTPINYGTHVTCLEDKCTNVSFRAVRVPFELDDLHEKYHNCLHGYKEDIVVGTSVIFEMLLHGKPAGCIELDGACKNCIQAYTSHNAELTGEAKKEFTEWIKRHNIHFDGNHMFGRARPHRAYWLDAPGRPAEMDIPF